MVERLKTARPEIAIGADLIAGFPTEDEAMFANTCALIDDCDIVHPHIFPYSPREGTPAARMPQVAPDVRKGRAALLRQAGAERRTAWLQSLVGTEHQVLVERPGDRGHTPSFAEVHWDNRPSFPDSAGGTNSASASPERPGGVGSIRNIRIMSANGTVLTGIAA